MELLKSKKGEMANKVVSIIVTIIAVFAILGGTASTLIAQSATVNTSGLPLASLFASNGVVLTLFMIGIMIGIIALVISKKKY